ncbi:MAG TPA: hypothetical protein VFS24_05720, partial [Steroidobacteraceae bacterium]|nr:hypothetical protein [Steroidobacteraceae bacterium]
MSRILAIAGLCSLLSSPAFAALSVSEAKSVAFLKSHQSESIALLQQIVDINSGTMNFSGVRKVADV